ncbi:hypothetical protein Btru_045608 [Bulinus truncatus]|nr:hypothetical protein Btru_045608 [Bulinus truncatus]
MNKQTRYCPKLGAPLNLNVMGDNKRPDLRRWLETMVRKRKCPGLEWENQEEMLFRLPWPHQKSRDWRQEDCQIYIEWAKHTGRYKEGDPMDFPTWKTRIRTAINKNREIEEITHLHKRDSASPYKVYRFLPTSPSRSRKDHNRLSPTSTVSDDLLPLNGIQDKTQFIETESPAVYSHNRHFSGGVVMMVELAQQGSLGFTLPTVVYENMDTSEDNHMAETMDTAQNQLSKLTFEGPPDCHRNFQNGLEAFGENLPEGSNYYNYGVGPGGLPSDLLSVTSDDLMNVSKMENVNSCASESVSPRPTEEIRVHSEDSNKVSLNECFFHVQVLYGIPGRVVNSCFVKTTRCRLFFGSPNSGTARADSGEQRTEIQMPNFEELDWLDDKVKDRINKALFEVEGGEVILTYTDDDIWAERRCLTKVFVTDGVSQSDVLPRSKKNRPPVETKIFDFKEKFIPELNELHNDPSKPVPKDFCYLTFGYEILKNDESPLRVVPVYVVVKHYKAVNLRHQKVQTLETKPLISANSSSFGSNGIRPYT